jgi:E3 ubiquitin-protein ligase DOA10
MKDAIMKNAPCPFGDPDYEWDIPRLTWKQVANVTFPTMHTSYDGLALADVIKTRQGRAFMQQAILMRDLRVRDPYFIFAAEVALEEHTIQAKTYHAKLRKQKRAQEASFQKAARAAEKEATKALKAHARQLKKEANDQAKQLKKEAAQQKKIAREQARAAKRIRAEAGKKPAKRRRKIVSSDESAPSTSSSSSSSASSTSGDDSDGPITLHPTLRPPPLTRTVSMKL